MIDRKLLDAMKNSAIRNYAVPGLDSFRIGGDGHGMVRLFEANHSHEEPITPHSHRFDFQCIVLAGEVRNIKWNKVGTVDAATHFMQPSTLIYGGATGEYRAETDLECKVWDRWYTTSEVTYVAGETYGMTHDEIHSIYFKRGTCVLFFEGPNLVDRSRILEPFCHGERVETFAVQPWMFQRATTPKDRHEQ